MADQVNIPQVTLNAITTYMANTLLTHLSVGTGSSDITLTTDDIGFPQTIGTGARNLAPIIGGVVVDNGFFSLHFRLTAASPLSQPINLQQIGIQTGLNQASGLKWGKTFPIAITKDTSSQWDIWVSGRTIELDKTNL